MCALTEDRARCRLEIQFRGLAEGYCTNRVVFTGRRARWVRFPCTSVTSDRRRMMVGTSREPWRVFAATTGFSFRGSRGAFEKVRVQMLLLRCRQLIIHGPENPWPEVRTIQTHSPRTNRTLRFFDRNRAPRGDFFGCH